MSLISRYTTPTHFFTLPFCTDDITELAIIYYQNDNVVLIKNLADCIRNDTVISVSLTEEETALFKPQGDVKIQLRVGIGEKRMNSKVLRVTVYDVLKDGLLSEISGGDAP